MLFLWLLLVASVSGIALDAAKIQEAQQHIQLFRLVLAKEARERDVVSQGHNGSWRDDREVLAVGSKQNVPAVSDPGPASERKPLKLEIGAPKFAKPLETLKVTKLYLPQQALPSPPSSTNSETLSQISHQATVSQVTAAPQAAMQKVIIGSPKLNKHQTVNNGTLKVYEMPVDQKVSLGLSRLLQDKKLNRSVFEIEPLFQKNIIHDTNINTEKEEKTVEQTGETVSENRHSNLRSVLESVKLPTTFHKSAKPEHVDPYSEPPKTVTKISYKDIYEQRDTPDSSKENKEQEKQIESVPKLEPQDVDRLLQAMMDQEDFKHVLNNMDDNVKDYVSKLTPKSTKVEMPAPASSSKVSIKDLIEERQKERDAVRETNEHKKAIHRKKESGLSHEQEGFFHRLFQRLFGPATRDTHKDSSSHPHASNAAPQPETYPSVIGVVMFLMFALFC